MWRNFKLILKSAREYKKYAIFTVILMIVESACDCALPSIMSAFIDIFDDKFSASDITRIWIFTGIFLAVAFVSLFCGLMGSKTSAKAAVGITNNLRYDLYRKIENFSFANIDKFSASSLVTRLTTDITNTFEALNMGIRTIIRAPLLMIFSIVMGFIVGGNMAWIFVGVVPLAAFFFFLLLKAAHRYFTRVFRRYDKLNQSVQENVAGIRVVKNFVREDYEYKKFAKASDDIYTDYKKAELAISFASPIVNFSIHLTNILVCGIGSWLIFTTAHIAKDGQIIWGALSTGNFSALLTYGTQILLALLFLTVVAGLIAMSFESLKRICEVLREEPTIHNPENPIMELDDGSVNFEKVTFKYSDKAESNALGVIDLKIKSGSFVGIIGATGSGKTTLVNLISRLYDITTGKLTVGGHEVNKYDLRVLRDSVAVVLQKNVLFSGTIAENLRWGDKNASDNELVKACKIAQADEFVQLFPKKYETYIEQGGSNVSGGQRQRLCLARALLKKPKILILDDSTSAVDTKTDALIREALTHELPSTTKIVIAQRTSSIANADMIVVMNNGAIDQIGTHKELLKSNKIYQEVYYTQNSVNGNGGGL